MRLAPGGTSQRRLFRGSLEEHDFALGRAILGAGRGFPDLEIAPAIGLELREEGALPFEHDAAVDG